MLTQLKLNEPYSSPEEARKARRNAFLGICFVIVIQLVVGHFLWQLSTLTNDPESLNISLEVSIDALILMFLSLIVFLYNSRIAAVLLFAVATFGFVSTWYIRATTTGNFAPPGLGIILLLSAGQLLVATYRTFNFEQTHSVKTPRSRWIGALISIVLSLSVVSFLLPPFHYVHYMRTQIFQIETVDLIEYRDNREMYVFSFPETWRSEQPRFRYGDVQVTSDKDSDVTVLVERWQPRSIVPTTLYSESAFLDMMRGEASSTNDVDGMVAESVSVLNTKGFNKGLVTLKNDVGQSRYILYVYDKSWSRQTSDSAFFFWRVTGDIPANSSESTTTVRSIVESFTLYRE